MRNILNSNKGFSLVELLIALFLTGIVSTAALNFYVDEHNSMLAQRNVSDMQQNLRVCMEEITMRARNAGASLPLGLQSITAANSNPDTLLLRYAAIGAAVEVGDPTNKMQASPIHVALGSDLSQFEAGMTIFLWHESTQTGEWFTITKVATNSGSGWEEIHHQGQPLTADPQIGDMVIVLQEARFYLDAADTALPLFMRQLNGGTPQVYAEGITDFQCSFLLPNLDTVDVPSANDTIVVINIAIAAQTNEIDIELQDREGDGRRRRSLSTQILVRNNRY